MKTNSKIGSKLYIPIVVFVYIGILVVSARYFNNPYLWFDEAGQFWISKGLNHDSAPMSECGNIMDVIENNQNYNLDPGGFGILLHYWSKISNHHRWLRVLPLSFFLLTILGFIVLSYNWTKNKYIASLAGLIPFMNWMILSEAYEIRAYSMEVLGVVVCILAIESLRKNISYSKLALWSMIIAIFMTSRYSFIIVAFVTSTYILYLIYKQDIEFRSKLLEIVVYVLPLFMVLFLDYMLAMRFQNPHIDALSYLPYIKTEPSVIFETSSMHIILFIGFLIWLLYQLKGSKLISQYQGLLYVTICTNVLFFVLSILGFHPWGGSCTRCISMITLIIISICALSGEMLKKLFEKANVKFIVLLFISLYLCSVGKGLHDDYKSRSNSYGDFISTDYSDKRIFVDRWESPCIRYLFEYGKLKGTANYPESFTFMKGEKHSRKDKDKKSQTIQSFYANQPYMNDLYENYDLLITPELYQYKSTYSNNWISVHDNKRVWIKKQ